MEPEWAERYEKRFSDFRLPKDVKARVVLAETIGDNGRRLLEYATQRPVFPGWPNWKRFKRCGGCGSSTLMRANKAQPGAQMTNCLPQRCLSRLPTISKPVTVARRARPGWGTKSISPRHVRTMNRISLWRS